MTIVPSDIQNRRYETGDAYTTEELRQIYFSSEAAARVGLLEQFAHNIVKIPIALALWATTDENPQVRRWYARHGRLLDYSQLELAECLENGLPELEQRSQFASDLKNNHEFSLLMVFLDDADPFVRACLRENPAFLDWVGADEAFRRSNYIEPLALLRNPALAPPWGAKAYGLLRFVLDPHDQTLKLSSEERKQLVLAYVADSDESRKGYRYRLDSLPCLENWQTLNALVSKWGPGSAVRPGCLLVRYPFYLTDDDVVAQFFSHCDDRDTRWNLLHVVVEEQIGHRSNFQKTFSVAASDPDPELRRMAYQLWPFTIYSDPDLVQLSGPTNEELAKHLAAGDVAVLKGLAGNTTLSTENHEKVLAKLQQLGVLKHREITLVGIPDTYSERVAREAPLAGIELLFGRGEKNKKDADDSWKRYGTLGAVHEDLWDLDRKMNLLAEKILGMDDWIGKRDEWMGKRIARLWAVAIAILVGVALLALKLVL
jgi:hypothetical protein